MKFVNYNVVLSDDTITIPLDHPCKCNVGLVEINMAEISSGNDEGSAIDITCDQIDSSFDNPDRLLRRIAFNRLRKNEYYHTWTAKYIQMKTVDSQDRYLTLKIRRTDNNECVVLGNVFEDKHILLTLAFSEVKTKNWTSYI